MDHPIRDREAFANDLGVGGGSETYQGQDQGQRECWIRTDGGAVARNQWMGCTPVQMHDASAAATTFGYTDRRKRGIERVGVRIITKRLAFAQENLCGILNSFGRRFARDRPTSPRGRAPRGPCGG